MAPGWAKKSEIFDGSGVGKKIWNFWWVRGGQKNLKFLMAPGVAIFRHIVHFIIRIFSAILLHFIIGYFSAILLHFTI
jgi:hypothetical protein